MSAAFTLLLQPKFVSLLADGTPNVGGKVYTYQAGTTTALTTYSDSGLTTTNTNPVVLDASGQADIWVAGPYKVVVTNATGVQLYTMDNLFGFKADLTASLPAQMTDYYLVWDAATRAFKNSGLTRAYIEQVVQAWATAMITNSGLIAASPTDTTPGTLSQKIVGATGTTTTILNAGGNEQLQVSAIPVVVPDPQLAAYQNAF